MSSPKRRPGRPSRGLSEERIHITLPSHLLAWIRQAAERDGVSVGEWLRRAAAASLTGVTHGR